MKLEGTRYETILTWIRAIVIFLVTVGCFMSCKTLRLHRKTVLTSKVNTDSTSSRHTTSTESINKKDSVIIVPGTGIDTNLTAKDLQPNYTVDGQKVPKIINQSKGNVSSQINVDTAGNINFKCKADSLLIVVRNLVEINRTLTDSLITRSEQEQETVKTDYTDKVVKWSTDWGWWILIIVAVMVVIEIRHRLFS